MNRGSASGLRDGNPVLERFNEAPIHESGKFPSLASMSPATAALQ